MGYLQIKMIVDKVTVYGMSLNGITLDEMARKELF
jgi:hypothetical protein